MTADVSPIFVDTNIIVYASSEHSAFSQAARTRLLDLKRQGHSLWISRQVIREFCAVTTKANFAPKPLSSELAARQGSRLSTTWNVAIEDSSTTAFLMNLIEKHDLKGGRVHDANIVATMICNGIHNLLTHDFQDFRAFEGMIRLMPLL